MAIDTPATIAILGGGPLGLEAALYARYLGYEVQLFERGQVAENVRRWGSATMLAPFRLNRSPLGLAALTAQDPNFQPPDDEALLTGHQWLQQYLLPLAQSDLLSGNVREQTEVLVVRRGVLEPDEEPVELGPDEELITHVPLLVDARDAAGQTSTLEADVVIDATGTLANLRPLESAGQPITGQRESAGAIEFHLPDLQGPDGAMWPLTGEPNFYVLGNASLASEGDFPFSDGLSQIRDLFALIGGRASLDLYKDVQRLI